MRTQYRTAILFGLLLPLMVQAQEEVQVEGRVVGAAGKPVAAAEIATFWNVENGKMKP